MTVKELIAELQRYDGELPVFVKTEDFVWPKPITAVFKNEIENTEFIQVYAYND